MTLCPRLAGISSTVPFPTRRNTFISFSSNYAISAKFVPVNPMRTTAHASINSVAPPGYPNEKISARRLSYYVYTSITCSPKQSCKPTSRQTVRFNWTLPQTATGASRAANIYASQYPPAISLIPSHTIQPCPIPVRIQSCYFFSPLITALFSLPESSRSLLPAVHFYWSWCDYSLALRLKTRTRDASGKRKMNFDVLNVFIIFF